MLLQVLTVSATRVNEVQVFVVTFTDTNGASQANMEADTINAGVDLDFTFDTENMLWACTSSSETTAQVIADTQWENQAC